MLSKDFRSRGPALCLEDFFEGRTEAWGLVEDRFGRLRRSFTCDVEGYRVPDGIRIEEQFSFDDGARERRCWLLERLSEGRYEGRTADLVGRAEGRVEGSVFHWNYRLRLPLGERKLVLRFDDWMCLRDDGLLINRARGYKFGLLLVEITILFRKPEADALSMRVAAE